MLPLVLQLTVRLVCSERPFLLTPIVFPTNTSQTSGWQHPSVAAVPSALVELHRLVSLCCDLIVQMLTCAAEHSLYWLKRDHQPRLVETG